MHQHSTKISFGEFVFNLDMNINAVIYYKMNSVSHWDLSNNMISQIFQGVPYTWALAEALGTCINC